MAQQSNAAARRTAPLHSTDMLVEGCDAMMAAVEVNISIYIIFWQCIAVAVELPNNARHYHSMPAAAARYCLANAAIRLSRLQCDHMF